MASQFQDADVIAAVQAECDKRNKHISKFHPLRWRPMWNHKDGWHPELKRIGEASPCENSLAPQSSPSNQSAAS